MVNMYWTLIIAKALYASESWNTEIVPCNKKGCINRVGNIEWTTKDDGNIIKYEPSIPAKTGLSIYKKMFGTSVVMNDIKRMKRSGKLKHRYQLPLTPGHWAIYKDLCLIFNILIGDQNLDTEDFLIAPPKRNHHQTRAGFNSKWTYNLKEKRAHHGELSIIRRHENLVDYLLSDEISMEEMRILTRDQRKEKIRRMVEQLPTSDNDTREEIWNGTFVPKNIAVGA